MECLQVLDKEIRLYPASGAHAIQGLQQESLHDPHHEVAVTPNFFCGGGGFYRDSAYLEVV